MDEMGIALFAPEETRPFAERVAAEAGIRLGRHRERAFEDGEHKLRPLESVRERDVFVIQSLYSDDSRSVNDKLCRLLFFLGAMRDASARRVTAVIPYLAYARKDRKTQTRDPVTTRYMAQIIESVGVDRVVTLDVHNLAAFQNAFRCRTDHLEAAPVFVDHVAQSLSREEPVAVVSPDVGGVKRAEAFRERLEAALGRTPAAGFFQKGRALGKLSYGRLVGDVEGCTVILMDDLIATGGTLVHAARQCREAGARRVIAMASHGVFVGDAQQAMADEALNEVVITDSIPPFRLPDDLVRQKIRVLSVAPLVAEAIHRIHEGGSIVELLEK